MRKRYCRYLPVIFIILYGIFIPLLSHAIQDRILHFDSHITVHQDSSLTVREVIKLQSAGEWLKDGFKYYFITRTIGKLGVIHRAGFSLIEVLRDGEPENCPIEEVSKGIQVHIGKQGLSGPGIHAYIIAYKWYRQIKYLGDRDELSRIITGSWEVPIDKITATVVLPSEASKNILSYDGQIKPEKSRSKIGRYPSTLWGISCIPPPPPLLLRS